MPEHSKPASTLELLPNGFEAQADQSQVAQEALGAHENLGGGEMWGELS